ncbi:MAG TPA: maleylpyruvate isomerase family mycothiol-dependent enzyme [Actinomycetota bacterium]|nr:maleylpyruvate isomerase family mycothiol-dependent enzyme [Actinomycetota bacterium]
MSLEREELLGIAHAERQRLGRMIQYADPGTWEQPSAAEGWWNRDVIAHLAAGDTIAAQLVAGEEPAELVAWRADHPDVPFDIDAFNDWTVSRRSGLDTREVLTLWGRAADSFLAHCASISDDDWASERFDYIAGPIAARYLVQTRVVEWWLHGEDVRATNGLEPNYEHWPVFLTIDLSVRMLPWSLGRDGYDLSGLTVRVDAEGAGEGSWHWGLGSGETPSARKAPDATIAGRAPQLALVAGQRLKPDDVLSSGAVVLGGDRQLADTVLRHLRAFP